MTITRYVISEPARQDLDGILNYGLDSYLPDTAYKYYSGFFDIFNLLVKQPYIGTTHENHESVRTFTYQHNHVIVYEIKTDHVSILRIFHGRQDIKKRFKYV